MSRNDTSPLILEVVSLLLSECYINAVLYDSLSLLNLFDINSLRLVDLREHLFRRHVKICLDPLLALLQELPDDRQLHYLRALFMGQPR